jgi:hypothetical protein
MICDCYKLIIIHVHTCAHVGIGNILYLYRFNWILAN